MSTCEPREPTPFRAPERVDPQPWDRLEAFLAAAGHRFTAGAGPRQFAGGFGNLNFLIEIDGRPMVLRRPPPGPLPPGGNDMAREYENVCMMVASCPTSTA